MIRCCLLLAVLSLGFAPAPLKPFAAPRKADDLPPVCEPRSDRWPHAFHWLSELADKPVIYTTRPAGTFSSFKMVRGRRLTAAEAVAILNRDLAAWKFRLLDRGRNYILVTEDD